MLPVFHKPADVAAQWGVSERRLKATARYLGACRIMGKIMFFTDEDLACVRPHLKPHGLVRQPDRRAVVYFLKCGPYIKIGFSAYFSRRLSALQSVSPFEIEVIATIPGTQKMERDLHKRFAAFHHRMEWFRHEGELADYIAGLAHG